MPGLNQQMNGQQRVNGQQQMGQQVPLQTMPPVGRGQTQVMHQQQAAPGSLSSIPGMGVVPSTNGMSSGVPANNNNNNLRPPPFEVASPTKAQSTMSSGSRQQMNIDPSQMPRPSPKRLPTQVFETRPAGTHAVPPSTDVALAVRDTGDAGPRHMRCSVNSMPQGHDMVKSSSIPLVLGIQPFALQGKGDSAIPLIDTRGGELVRCAKCNAYVCPGMTFRGGIMTCCFCGGSTGVGMVQGDAPSVFGTVEYVVDGKYQVREPMVPTYLFLIDCTAEAVASGMTATVCSSIRALLGTLVGVAGTAGGTGARVAVTTFTSAVQFYELGGAGAASGTTGASGDGEAHPKMFVVGDVEEPFCPLTQGAFVALASESDASRVATLLDRIPQIFAEKPREDNVRMTSGESAGGAAMKAGVEALSCVGGGRLLTFLHSLPHKGVLALKPRESGKPPSDREALEIMSPQATSGKQYAQLARAAVENQVCVDIFALTKSYIDLATISTLSLRTSGSVYRYAPFSHFADTARFYDDLRWNLTRPGGMEAVGKLRVSSGLSVEEVLGCFTKAGEDDLVFPAINSDSTIFAKLVHDERLREGSHAYFQFATLYSTIAGQRRVRVHSMGLPVSRSLGSVFRGADLEIYMGYLARQAAAGMASKSLSQLRDAINKAATGTLVAYRKHCASSSSSSGQLILPESLKLIPLFCLGLKKLPGFRTDARADGRAVWLSRIASLPLDRLLPAVHPRLLRICLEVSEQPLSSSGEPTLPDFLPLSAEHLDSAGVYVLENGYDIFLFVGRDVAPAAIEQLLGTSSLQSIDPATFADLPQQNNPLSKQTRELIAQIRRQRRSYMHMRLVVKGHPYETLFYSALVEDRHLSSGVSYVEYLCFLHRQIQNKIS